MEILIGTEEDGGIKGSEAKKHFGDFLAYSKFGVKTLICSSQH